MDTRTQIDLVLYHSNRICEMWLEFGRRTTGFKPFARGYARTLIPALSGGVYQNAKNIALGVVFPESAAQAKVARLCCGANDDY